MGKRKAVGNQADGDRGTGEGVDMDMEQIRRTELRSPYFNRPDSTQIPDLTLVDMNNEYCLWSLLLSSYEVVMRWMQRQGLLTAGVICRKCTFDKTNESHEVYSMALQQRSSALDRHAWRCSVGHERSVRVFSMFSRSHLLLPDLLRFICGYATQMTLLQTCLNSGLSYKSSGTVWGRRIRRLFRQYYYDVIKPVKFRGIIEIDEALFGRKVKHNRGKVYGTRVWLVGMVERDTNRMKLFPVDNRDKKTLTDLVLLHCEKGSTIYTDGWKAYNDLSSVGYRHFPVNHTEGFSCKYRNVKNPQHEVNVNTNTVEGAWTHARGHFRRMNGTSIRNFENHLTEIMWRNWVRGRRLADMLALVRDMYPLDGMNRLTAPCPLFPTWLLSETQPSTTVTVHRDVQGTERQAKLNPVNSDDETDTELVGDQLPRYCRPPAIIPPGTPSRNRKKHIPEHDYLSSDSEVDQDLKEQNKPIRRRRHKSRDAHSASDFPWSAGVHSRNISAQDDTDDESSSSRPPNDTSPHDAADASTSSRPPRSLTRPPKSRKVLHDQDEDDFATVRSSRSAKTLVRKVTAASDVQHTSRSRSKTPRAKVNTGRKKKVGRKSRSVVKTSQWSIQDIPAEVNASTVDKGAIIVPKLSPSDDDHSTVVVLDSDEVEVNDVNGDEHVGNCDSDANIPPSQPSATDESTRAHASAISSSYEGSKPQMAVPPLKSQVARSPVITLHRPVYHIDSEDDEDDDDDEDVYQFRDSPHTHQLRPLTDSATSKVQVASVPQTSARVCTIPCPRTDTVPCNTTRLSQHIIASNNAKLQHPTRFRIVTKNGTKLGLSDEWVLVNRDEDKRKRQDAVPIESVAEAGPSSMVDDVILQNPPANHSQSTRMNLLKASRASSRLAAQSATSTKSSDKAQDKSCGKLGGKASVKSHNKSAVPPQCTHSAGVVRRVDLRKTASSAPPPRKPPLYTSDESSDSDIFAKARQMQLQMRGKEAGHQDDVHTVPDTPILHIRD